MEGHKPQAHQELSQQRSRHYLSREEAEGRGAQVASSTAPRIQGEESSEKKIDEGAAQGEVETEGAQWDQGW